MTASARLKILIKGNDGTVCKENKTMKRDARVDALMAIAKKLEREGVTDGAEQLYRKAVNTSELLYGPASPRTGLALLELMTFCESHDNSQEADNLWKRLRIVFLECEE